MTVRTAANSGLLAVRKAIVAAGFAPGVLRGVLTGLMGSFRSRIAVVAAAVPRHERSRRRQ